MHLRSIVLLLVFFFGSIAALAQSKTSLLKQEWPKLQVQITADKSVYKVGEPIIITVTLRNVGNSIVWMSKPRGVGIYPGEFYIDAVGPDGRVMPNKSPVMASDEDSKTQPLSNTLQSFLCKRVPLFPGEFWGVTRNLEDAFVSLTAPGRYKLTAKYNEHAIEEDFSEEQLQKLQAEVKFPIQGEAVASDPITVEIR